MYVENYVFALRRTDYFIGTRNPSPFEHFWSLGVEEQFYLLWPVLIVVTARCASRRTGSAGPLPYLIVLGVVAALSFWLSLRWTHTVAPWAYFSLPTRAWELAAGGLVALLVPMLSRTAKPVAALAGWFGLVLITMACVQLDRGTLYPGTAALIPATGAALMIASGCAATRFSVTRILVLPPVRAVGRVSDSWYLWHWPVLVLAPVILGHPLGPAGTVITIAVPAGLAALTWWLVENPLRFADALRRSPARSLGCGAAIVVVAAGVAVSLTACARIPAPHGPSGAPLAFVTAAGTPGASDRPDEMLRSLEAQAEPVIAASDRMRVAPSNLTPPVGDQPTLLDIECLIPRRPERSPECVSGDPHADTRVALIGDSNATMWFSAFEPLAEQRHWRLETLTKAACPPMDLPIHSSDLEREYFECDRWRAWLLAHLREEHPHLVVVAMTRTYTAELDGVGSYSRTWNDSVNRLVSELRDTGAAVLLLGAIPTPPTDPQVCLSEHLNDVVTCTPARTVAVRADGIAAEQESVRAAGGSFADLTPLFCTRLRCPLVIGNSNVYLDDSHITPGYAQILAPVMSAFVDRALNGG
nr:acyltransferase family protein [Nocardia wallacei]